MIISVCNISHVYKWCNRRIAITTLGERNKIVLGSIHALAANIILSLSKQATPIIYVQFVSGKMTESNWRTQSTEEEPIKWIFTKLVRTSDNMVQSMRSSRYMLGRPITRRSEMLHNSPQSMNCYTCTLSIILLNQMSKEIHTKEQALSSCSTTSSSNSPMSSIESRFRWTQHFLHGILEWLAALSSVSYMNFYSTFETPLFRWSQCDDILQYL